MKNLPLFAIAVSVLLVVVLGCGKPQTSTRPQQQEAPVSISATILTKEYEENEVAADKKYRGKILNVMGSVSDIAETFGTVSVQLKGSGLTTVMCSVNDSQKDKVARLKKGDQVSVIGVGDGMTAGLYVGISDCEIR